MDLLRLREHDSNAKNMTSVSVGGYDVTDLSKDISVPHKSDIAFEKDNGPSSAAARVVMKSLVECLWYRMLKRK